MPKNILIDLNVILDVLLERQGFETSLKILQLGESAACHLFVSAHCVTTFGYLLEHAKVPRTEISRQIDWLLQTFTVVAVDSRLLKAAQRSKVMHYEDAIIEQAALSCHGAIIVTRNMKDFKNSVVAAVSPEKYLQKQAAKKYPGDKL